MINIIMKREDKGILGKICECTIKKGEEYVCPCDEALDTKVCKCGKITFKVFKEEVNSFEVMEF